MLKQIEKIFAVAMLFYATGALTRFIGDGTHSLPGEDFHPLAFAVQAAFYTVAFFFIVLHWRTVLRGAWNAKWILLLVLVTVASTVWSQHPLVTLKRSIVMLASTAFGIYFGSRFTVYQQLRLLGYTCALIVFTSFFMAIFLPQYGIDHLFFPGAWLGAFSHKNALGSAMAFSLLVFQFLRRGFPNWIRWLGTAAALCSLTLSRSLSGPLVLAAVIMTVLLIKLLRLKSTFSIPTMMAVSLLALGAVSALGVTIADVFRLLGRNSTLTGEAGVWEAVLHSIAKRPWLGYGFGAFWTKMPGESDSITRALGWVPYHAHNGFLDVTLQVGIVGLSLLLVSYVALWRSALRLMRKTTGVVPIWLCAYLAFILFSNSTETEFLIANNILWILYTSSAVWVSLYAPAPSGHLSHSPLPATFPEQVEVAG